MDWQNALLANLAGDTRRAYAEDPYYSAGVSIGENPLKYNPYVDQPSNYMWTNAIQGVVSGLMRGLGDSHVRETVQPSYLQLAQALDPSGASAKLVESPNWQPGDYSGIISAMMARDQQDTNNQILAKFALEKQKAGYDQEKAIYEVLGKNPAYQPQLADRVGFKAVETGAPLVDVGASNNPIDDTEAQAMDYAKGLQIFNGDRVQAREYTKKQKAQRDSQYSLKIGLETAGDLVQRSFDAATLNSLNPMSEAKQTRKSIQAEITGLITSIWKGVMSDSDVARAVEPMFGTLWDGPESLATKTQALKTLMLMGGQGMSKEKAFELSKMVAEGTYKPDSGTKEGGSVSLKLPVGGTPLPGESRDQFIKRMSNK